MASLCIVLSKDDSLIGKLEEALVLLPAPPSLIPIREPSELEAALDTLEGVRLMIVDQRHFATPQVRGIPVLLLDMPPLNALPQAPLLCFPIRPEEAAVQIHMSLTDTIPPPATTAGFPSPLEAFYQSYLREIIHDLNNRQTTLQGNLPLLEEGIPDRDVLEDLRTAAEKTGRLIRQLEAMKDDQPTLPERVSSGEFLSDLNSFCRRIFDIPGCDVKSTSADTGFFADPSQLLLMILQLLSWLQDPESTLTVQCASAGQRLEFVLDGGKPHTQEAREDIPVLVSRLDSRLKGMGVTLNSTDTGLSLSCRAAPTSPSNESVSSRF